MINYHELNPLNDDLCWRYIKTYLYFHTFLNIDMVQEVEILPGGRQEMFIKSVNPLSADDLVTVGARASAAIVLT